MVRHCNMGGINHVLNCDLPAVREVAVLPDEVGCSGPELRVLQLPHHAGFCQCALQGSIRRALAPHPKEPVAHLGWPDSCTRPRVQPQALQFALADLGQGCQATLAIEAPPMVGAQERPIILNSALAQRHVAMRAAVLEHAPCASGIPPRDEVLAKQL